MISEAFKQAEQLRKQKNSTKKTPQVTLVTDDKQKKKPLEVKKVQVSIKPADISSRLGPPSIDLRLGPAYKSIEERLAPKKQDKPKDKVIRNKSKKNRAAPY